MICPNCEQPVDDNSVACPHCGTALERKYCPTCGQSLEGDSNKRGVAIFVGFVLIVIIIVLVSNRSTSSILTTRSQPATTTETRQDIRPGFQILSQNTITLGSSSVEEWMIRVDSTNKQQIIDAALQAIDEAKSGLSAEEVSVYVYNGDDFALDQSKWKANVLYYRPDNTTATIPTTAEKLAENTFVRWQD